MQTNISHTLPQWLEFGFVTAMDAVFILIFFCISWKLLRPIIHHGPNESDGPLLPDYRPVTPPNLHYRLTLALTSLLITTLFFAYLLTATIGINDTLSSWRLNYESPHLIFQFLFQFGLTAIIVHKREFPQGQSHMSVGLSVGIYFSLITWMFVSFSIARVLEGRAMLLNEILCLGTLPITAIHVGFGIKEYCGSKGTDELGEQDVVGEAA